MPRSGKPTRRAAPDGAKRPAAAAPSGSDRLSQLVERNYDALREIAEREIAARRMARSVSPSSLVAEAMVRLMRQRTIPETVPHLCGLSTILMGHALADRLRRSRAGKRNGGRKPLPLPEEVLGDRRSSRAHPERSDGDPLRERLLEALQSLAKSHPREMEVVTLRLVLELPIAKVAKLVGISERTTYRDLDEGLVLLKRSIGLMRP